MKEASDQLYEAENTASTSHHKAQHDTRAFASNIYDRGSEFALCQAEAQIMSAVVGVLNESLTESIKGFYKLRKAYITLESLVHMEMNFMKTQGVRSLSTSRQLSAESFASTGSGRAQTEKMPPPAADVHVKGSETTHANVPSGLRHAELVTADSDSSGAEDFYDLNDDLEKSTVTEAYRGKLEVVDNPHFLDKKMEALKIPDSGGPSRLQGVDEAFGKSAMGLLDLDPDSDVFSNSLDVFIHSGTNLMSGLLNLLISVIPPAFTRLLYIIGFRGDREKGIRMLWQASKFSNINGGMAGLIIFGWYNSLIGFCDIIPDSDPGNPVDNSGYPLKRLQMLLAEMRKRYPNSYLWLLEEARMAAIQRNLEQALEILSRPGRSNLKQLEALQMFEKSLSSMNAHQYQLCADSFIACVDLNGWSQSLYYYIAAAAHLQVYRNVRGSDPSSAEQHKKIAEEYFKTAPSKVGKKKMMGRQLPFDTFVLRKISKWEERAARWHCSFIDAIGVSPVEEMTYLWNGYKKMNQSQLEESLGNLAWSESTTHWQEEDPDEYAILALLRSVVLRNLRQHDESMEILRVKILDLEPHSLKGHNRDDWPAPAGHYEMAANLWMQRSDYIRQHGTNLSGPDNSLDAIPMNRPKDVKLVEAAKTHIEKAKNWEKYELDARIGMKVTAAQNTIKGWEQKNLTAR